MTDLNVQQKIWSQEQYDLICKRTVYTKLCLIKESPPTAD